MKLIPLIIFIILFNLGLTIHSVSFAGGADNAIDAQNIEELTHPNRPYTGGNAELNTYGGFSSDSLLKDFGKRERGLFYSNEELATRRLMIVNTIRSAEINYGFLNGKIVTTVTLDIYPLTNLGNSTMRFVLGGELVNKNSRLNLATLEGPLGLVAAVQCIDWNNDPSVPCQVSVMRLTIPGGEDSPISIIFRNTTASGIMEKSPQAPQGQSYLDPNMITLKNWLSENAKTLVVRTFEVVNGPSGASFKFFNQQNSSGESFEVEGPLAATISKADTNTSQFTPHPENYLLKKNSTEPNKNLNPLFASGKILYNSYKVSKNDSRLTIRFCGYGPISSSSNLKPCEGKNNLNHLDVKIIRRESKIYNFNQIMALDLFKYPL